jgi:hypothetical protein
LDELAAFLVLAALLHGLFAGVAGIWERCLEEKKSVNLHISTIRGQDRLLWTARNEIVRKQQSFLL